MVNFNTKEIKVALYEAVKEINPLSQARVDNVIAALNEAFNQKSNVVLVLAFCRHILPAKAGYQIQKTVTARGGTILCYHPALVIMTTQGKSINVYFIGGIGTFFSPAPDSSSEESDDDEIEVLEVRKPAACNQAPAPASGTTKKGNDNTVKRRNINSTDNYRSVKEEQVLKEDRVAESPLTPAQPPARRRIRTNNGTTIPLVNCNSRRTKASGKNLRKENNDASSISSFEDTVGLTQELF
jgi:hypothetical protein